MHLLSCCALQVNAVILVLAGALCVQRHLADEEKRSWRNAMSSEQFEILNNVSKSITSGGEVRKSLARDPQVVLKQFLIAASEVDLLSKIGAGNYGEVFKAKWNGQTYAAKTMKDVTEESARAFRSELLLTGSLRHPKIVNFAGACWEQELTCMLLEWCPNGALGDLLEKEGLLWEKPLLDLAIDVAQGMSYLHGREYFDEQDGSYKKCIIHRDLKPDNGE